MFEGLVQYWNCFLWDWSAAQWYIQGTRLIPLGLHWSTGVHKVRSKRLLHFYGSLYRIKRKRLLMEIRGFFCWGLLEFELFRFAKDRKDQQAQSAQMQPQRVRDWQCAV